MWGNTEQYGQGQQRTESMDKDSKGQSMDKDSKGQSMDKDSKDRENWRPLVEGYSLKWKDTA